MKMMNDDKEFDMAAYKGIIDEEMLFSLWAKIEIAKVLINRANTLTAEVNSDIEFYSMMTEMNNN